MSWWVWLLDAAALLVALTVLAGVALVVRRRLLARHGGTFELSHRVRSPAPGRGWVLGLGRYSGERLEWFRIFSLSPRPKRSWRRAELTYDSRRQAADAERSALFPGHLVVRCRWRGAPLELAMAPDSFTGLQSWLEARPPGTDWDAGR